LPILLFFICIAFSSSILEGLLLVSPAHRARRFSAVYTEMRRRPPKAPVEGVA
jgi:hypothetical protein